MGSSRTVIWKYTDSAFGDVIRTAVIVNKGHTNTEEFLKDARDVFRTNIDNLLKKHKELKISSTLKYEILKMDEQISKCDKFPLGCYTMYEFTIINDWWRDSIAKDVLDIMDTIYENSNGCENVNIANLKFNIHKVTTMYSPSEPVMKLKTSVKFENFQNKEKLPFVIYATFVDVHEQEHHPGEHKRKDPAIIAYYLKCSYDNSLSYYRTNDYSQNSGQWFVKEFKKLCKYFKNKFETTCGRNYLTPAEQDIYIQAKRCYLCEKPFTVDNIKEPDYFLLSSRKNNRGSLHSNYRGPAHRNCINDYRKSCQIIPVIIPKLTSAIGNYIIKNVSPQFNSSISIVADRTINKYVSIKMNITNDSSVTKFKFLDYSRLLALTSDPFENSLLSEFLDISSELFNATLTKRDIICPYDIVMNANSLSADLDSLKHIEHKESDKYSLTQRVWQHFKIKSLGEYMKLYTSKEIMLLMNSFEIFRNKGLEIYQLDPAYYYTFAAFAWDSMLLKTEVKLEILPPDDKKLQFILKANRGGYYQTAKRRSTANNKYMQNYNFTEESKQLIEFDMNNQSAWSMSHYLPYGGFEWETTWFDKDIEWIGNKIIALPKDSPVGYILQVDLEYPRELHNLHRDLPFCPQTRPPPGSNKNMLLATLYNKDRYVLHYVNLKQAIEFGLILKKVHKVLRFKQSPWMKEFIDLNTNQRKLAKDNVERLLFKKMNNIVHGKSYEDPNKFIKVAVTNRRDTAERMILSSNFKGSKIFNERLVAMMFDNKEITLMKPRYLGVIIAELSKTSMFDFHYGYVKKIFAENVSLLYANTDSFIYELRTHDFYQLIKQDCQERFDTTNYSNDNDFEIPQVNKFEPGKMKDVNAGLIMVDFVGLNSKLYASRFVDRLGNMNTVVVGAPNENITFNDYETCLENFTKHPDKFQENSKDLFGISAADKKRYLIPNSYETLPWGHYQVLEPENNMQQVEVRFRHKTNSHVGLEMRSFQDTGY